MAEALEIVRLRTRQSKRKDDNKLQEVLQDSNTPNKRRERRLKSFQSERKPKQSKRRRPSDSGFPFDNTTVEQLTTQTMKYKKSAGKTNKLLQSCFVDIETITPKKLNLVKTINTPLLQIKNEIVNRRNKKHVDDVQLKNDGDSENNETNNTLTLSDEEGKLTKIDNMYTEASEDIENVEHCDKKVSKKINAFKYDKCKSFTFNDNSYLLNHSMDSPRKLRKKWTTCRKTIFDFRNSYLGNANSVDKNDNQKTQENVNLNNTHQKNDDEVGIFNEEEHELNLVSDRSGEEENITANTTARSFENVTLRRKRARKSPDVSPTKSFVSITAGNLYGENVALDSPSRTSELEGNLVAQNNSTYELIETTVDITGEIPANDTPTRKHIIFAPNNLGDESDVDPRESQLKRKSIAKRLSTIKKPEKSKLQESSRVTKKKRLSSVALSRTPRISGSKSMQLYDFLTDGQSGISTNDTSGKDSTTILGTPPSSSSTPKVLKKRVINSLLKSTLKKEKYNVTFDGNVSKIEPSVTDSVRSKNVSRVKMPNFSAIHKKQFDKMESISDYKHRKNERAMLLLSGNKPHGNNKSNMKCGSKCNQPLTDEFKQIKTPNIEGQRNTTNGFSLLPETPDNTKHTQTESYKNQILKEIKLQSQTPVKNKRVRVHVSPNNNVKHKSNLVIRKTPFKIKCSSMVSKESSNEKAVIMKSNKPTIKLDNPKCNMFSQSTSSKLPGEKENGATKSVNSGTLTGYTRFGFRVPISRRPKKEDVVKSVSNKCRIHKFNDMEGKRTVIKGVRSNRRFDLLMKMREKN